MPLDIQQIRVARPQNVVHYFASIGSTMTEGARLANEDAPHGTVIVADEQTAGLGRLGRTWVSERDAGLYTSTLLRLSLAPANLPLASLLLGLATARAIQESTSLACDLRWPNDVLIDERKVAGILPHLVNGYVVAGIGINVNNRVFRDDLRTPATSLLLAGGSTVVSRESLLIKLLESIEFFCAVLAENGPGAILRSFTQASSYARDRRVTVEETGAAGTTAGLDDNGFLLLRLDGGSVQRIASGGVRATV